MSNLATIANRLHVACCYVAKRHHINPPAGPCKDSGKLNFKCLQYIHFLERPELIYMQKYHQEHIKTSRDN